MSCLIKFCKNIIMKFLNYEKIIINFLKIKTMKKLLHIVLLTLMFLTFSLVGISQQRYLSGTVTDATTSQPIKGVSVKVKGTNTVSITDEYGFYKIKIPDTLRTIEFSKFKNMEISKINLIDKNTINIILTSETDLFDLTLEELMEFQVVSASKYEEPLNKTPASILVITEKDIQNRVYTSLTDILYDIPGFDISASHGNLTQMSYARGNRTGSFNERTLLMINGVEHNILYAQNMNLSTDFPVSAIERIEVLYGPSSAVYGANAFSGIINVITKSAKNFKVNKSQFYSNVIGGSYNTFCGDMTYLAKYGPIGISASYRRYMSENFDMTNSPGYFDESIFGNKDIWGPYAEYYPEFQNPSDDYGFLSSITFKNFELGYNNLQTKHGNGGEYPYDKTLPTPNWKFKKEVIYFKYSKNINDKLSFHTLATHQISGSPTDNIWAQGWNSANSWDSMRTVEMLTWKYISKRWTFSEDFIYSPLDFLIINGGVKIASGTYQKSYEFGYSDQTSWMPGQQWQQPDLLFPDPRNENNIPGNTYTDKDYGVFLQTKFKLINNRLNIVAGARYDYNTIYKESFNPRVGFTFQLTKNLFIKSNYGTAFQQPAPRNLYGSWGGLTVNENLEAEEIQTVDFSFLTITSNFTNEITAFYNIVTNSVQQGINLPEKNMYGAEVKFNYIVPVISKNIKNLSFHFNYTYIDAKYESPISNVTTGRSSDIIGDIAPHKANFIAGIDFFDLIHWNITANYVSEKQTVVSNPIEKVEQFYLLNSSLQIINLFDEKISIFANAENILDTKYFHPGMDNAGAGEDLSVPSQTWYNSRLPQPGRRFMFGIRGEF